MAISFHSPPSSFLSSSSSISFKPSSFSSPSFKPLAPYSPFFPSISLSLSLTSNPQTLIASTVNGGGGDDHFPPSNPGGGGGGGGDDDDDNEDEDEEAEFGPVMRFDEVMKELEARGAEIPADMMEAARTVGIRRVLLMRFLELQGSGWLLGWLMRSCSMLRNRMLADPSFLFKVGTEVVIDSCCATFAEVRKRGKDFWAEFELYAADLLVGVVVDIALVGLLAPYVRIGKPAAKTGFFAPFRRLKGMKDFYYLSGF